ncbi:MAG: hypothetical protein RLZZ292_494 [Bacteroidota bacterium]|jgi:hypothetical protein
MNHQEFDHHINRMFQEEEEQFEVNDQVWESVATRLDANEKSARKTVAIGWQRWALPLAAAVLLLLNGAWYAAWKTTQNEVNGLKALVCDLQNTDNQFYINKNNNLYKKETSIKTDTIYKTIIVTKYIYTIEKKQNETATTSGNSSTNTSVTIDLNTKITSNTNSAIPINHNLEEETSNTADNTQVIPTKEQATNDTKKTLLSNLDFLPNLSLKPLIIKNKTLQIPAQDEQMMLAAAPKQAFSLRRAMTPNSYATEVVGGFIAPVRKTIISSNGGQYGISGEAMMNSRWSILGSATKAEIHYILAPTDTLFGVPKLHVPASDYTLKSLEATNTLLQFNLGLKHFFYTNKRISTYLSMVYTIQSASNLEAQYEFVSAKNPSIFLSKEADEKQNRSQYLTFGMGLNYNFYKKWSVKIGGNYQYALRNKVDLPNLASAQLGLRYQF